MTTPMQSDAPGNPVESSVSPEVHDGSATLQRTKRTQERALAAFRELGTVSAACLSVGIGRRTWYDMLERDAEFAREVMEASEAVADELEAEAIRRAQNGSDALLMFLLRARRRPIYGDKQELTIVSPDVRVRVSRMVDTVSRFPGLSDDARNALLDELERIWTA